MSQRLGFFFVNLRHVVADDLDLHVNGVRSRQCGKANGDLLLS